MTRVRSDVRGLGPGWNDTLLWYARAVRTLQSRPLTDPTSWRFLAAIHGMHPTVWRQFGVIQANTPAPPAAVQRRFWNQCQHQSWYFLPWHRGYLARIRGDRSPCHRRRGRAGRLGAAVLELQRLDPA